jgi:hypothetical protein
MKKPSKILKFISSEFAFEQSDVVFFVFVFALPIIMVADFSLLCPYFRYYQVLVHHFTCEQLSSVLV